MNIFKKKVDPKGALNRPWIPLPRPRGGGGSSVMFAEFGGFYPSIWRDLLLSFGDSGCKWSFLQFGVEAFDGFPAEGGREGFCSVIWVASWGLGF